MAGAGTAYFTQKLGEYQQLVATNATRVAELQQYQEQSNAAAQKVAKAREGLALMQKTNPTADDMENLIELYQAAQ